MNEKSIRGTAVSPLLMLVYHFAPSNEIGARRSTACAADLVKHGIPVVVVSAFGNQEPRADATPDGIRRVWVPYSKPWILKSLVAIKQAVSRLWKRRPHKGKAERTVEVVNIGSPKNSSKSWLPARIATLIDSDKNWSVRAARRARRVAGRHAPLAVMASGPPMSSLIAARWLAPRLRVPLIIDLRDPWLTGSKWETEANDSLEAHARRYFERDVLSHARLIFVATEGMAEHLRTRYHELAAKVHVVRNGFDGEPAAPKLQTNHRLEFLFAGEIYVNRDPFPFLDAIDRLLRRADVDASRVGVTFVGRCDESMEASLQQWVQETQRQANIRVLRPVPYDQIVSMTARATVLLNLAQHASVMIPAKAYEHIASGREVLLISEKNTDVFRMFDGIAGISCVETDDAAALDQTLSDLYQRHAVDGRANPPASETARSFSRTVQQQRFRSIMTEQGIFPRTPG
jgi:glycosyltransferase involved in cell wall biosynthesis